MILVWPVRLGAGHSAGSRGFRVLLVASVFAVLLLNLVLFTATAHAATTSDVAKEFICNCGCGENLDSCSSTMKECGIGQDMRKIISEKVAAGDSKADIGAYMMKNYGEKVLTAPTKEGFNIVGWIAPFAATGVAAILVYVTIFRWVRQSPKVAVATKGAGGKDKYSRKVDEELDKFDY